MTIEVLCPKGHRLSCNDDRAGTWGKCPRCGTPVRIPSSNGQGDPKEILFLCPNGHKLHGPASLQGLPGKCPHCQSKFRIPVIGEDEPADSVLTSPIDDSVKGSYLGHIGSLEELSNLNLTTSPAGEAGSPSPALAETSAAEPPSEHAMARLFAALWRFKDPAAVVELHLANGQRLTPHFWSPGHGGDVGLFATRNDRGGYLVHAVAWAHVQRITLSGIEQLPPGMFDQ